ncbi:sensor histidine kinase [Pseudoalteromonas spongiae]|uniref:sensor histidine kinase n=1 Tax=Pseudoalteromonas spongiae TaxID=298657 RepID=UPI000C2D69F3|nr:histidine kinase [Pseudoalteromonas spongiae]
MAYWVIQALIALILLLGGLSNIDTDKEMHGLANTFAYAGIRTLSFFLITHFLIRAPINFLRNKEAGFMKVFICGLVFVTVGSFIAKSIRDISRNTFVPIDNEITYYRANPDKDPLNQVKTNSEVEENTDTQDETSANATAKSEFKRGFKEGFDQAHIKAREELEKIHNGDQEAIDRASSQQLKSQFGALLFWLFCYLPLSGLKRRFQVKTQLKQSQIALLMSQLNPHFLFNSLNSIRGMIFEDKQLAKELIDKLNELFRYNLTANKHPTVKLKEELRICEFYLDIEHIRLEERLLIEMHVDETCLNIKVPTMGILTLIENSIKHGIAPRQDQSLLIVDIAKQKNQLVVTVSNPIYTGTYKVESTGTGQENLIKRLQLMYNDNASLNAEFKDDKYIACLTLPI